MIDPKFFQTRQPDNLNLESFMQAAIEAAKTKAYMAQVAKQNQPVGGEVSAPVMYSRNPLQNQQQVVSNNPLQTVSNLKRVEAQRTPQDIAQNLQFQKYQYEIKKEEAFNRAIAEGRAQDAAALDPFKFADYQESKQKLALQQQQAQLINAQVQNTQQKMLIDQNKVNEDSNYDKYSAEAAAKRYGELQDSVPALQDFLQKVQAAKDAYGQIYTGLGGENIAPYVRGAQALIGVDKAPEQAAELAIRDYQGSQILQNLKYLKPVSNDELKFAKTLTPGLATNPEAAQAKVEFDAALARRALAKAEFIKQYLLKEGDNRKSQEQAEMMWNNYVENNKILMNPSDLSKGLLPGANIDNPMSYFAQKELQKRRAAREKK